MSKKKTRQQKWRKFKKKYAWMWQLFLMLLAVAVCALLIINAIAQAGKPEEEDDVPIFWEYDAQGRPYIDDYTFITVYEREDLNAPVVERQYFGADGAIAYSYSYVYDAEGRLIRRNTYDPNTLLIGFSEYLYDQNGRNYRTNCYEDDEFVSYFLNTFDMAGNKAEAAEYDEHDALIERWVYAYDRDGEPESVTLYSADGAVLGTRDYDISLD